MTVFWTIIGSVLLIVWVLTLVDIFRRHYPGWTIVGYVALVLIVPFIGSLIYWAVRKPTPAEAEQKYLAEAETRRQRAAQ